MVPKIDQVNPVGNPYERFANSDNVYLKLVAVEKNEKLNFFDNIARKFHLGGFRLSAIVDYIAAQEAIPTLGSVKEKLQQKITKYNGRWHRKIFTSLQIKTVFEIPKRSPQINRSSPDEVRQPLSPQLPSHIASIQKQVEVLSKNDQEVFGQLRNYFFILDDPQDDDFQAAKNEIGQLKIAENAPYIIQEAYILSKKRAENSDDIHHTQEPIEAVDEIFDLIWQCESVKSEEVFLEIESQLNQLSQEQLIGKELSGIHFYRQKKTNRGITKLSLEAKFDDFFDGSVFRKATYPLGNRQFTNGMSLKREFYNSSHGRKCI